MFARAVELFEAVEEDNGVAASVPPEVGIMGEVGVGEDGVGEVVALDASCEVVDGGVSPPLKRKMINPRMANPPTAPTASQSPMELCCFLLFLPFFEDFEDFEDFSAIRMGHLSGRRNQ